MSDNENQITEKQVLHYASEKSVFLTADALKILKTQGNFKNTISHFSKNTNKAVVTAKDVNSFENKDNKFENNDQETILTKEKVRIEKTNFKPAAKDIESQLTIHEKTDITGKSRGEGKKEDFIRYFNKRYEQLSTILKNRSSLNSIKELDRLNRVPTNKDICVIAMVSEKRRTKNNHTLIELEDPTGTALALVLEKNTDIANQMLLDDVVAIKGRLIGNGDLLLVNEVIWPDTPFIKGNRAEEEVFAAFTSDVHIGSKLFMKKEFNNMIKWLNGNYGSQKSREIVGKIKYLFIAGDLVDGIGIFPGQDKELETLDIYKQYDEFSAFMAELPDYIEVIIGPGNHDAVRVADPQPAVPKEFLKDLYGCKNMHFVGSPTTITTHNVKTTMYHGTSLDPIIAAFPDASYEKPTKAMLEILKRRNLSLTYGNKPITMEETDYLSISEVPDILLMGHIHKNDYEMYHGTYMMNVGTWQLKTPLQDKMNFEPTPGIVPVLDLKSFKLTEANFNKALSNNKSNN
ncbi:MAG: DNA-directed DNA polymerase II small subunit [Candidatus Diapherotrites archaeon]|nr:DNA-directed DNA polymerase II small subunit [Candidatus Diapherotrites archaeon]